MGPISAVNWRGGAAALLTGRGRPCLTPGPMGLALFPAALGSRCAEIGAFPSRAASPPWLSLLLCSLGPLCWIGLGPWLQYPSSSQRDEKRRKYGNGPTCRVLRRRGLPVPSSAGLGGLHGDRFLCRSVAHSECPWPSLGVHRSPEPTMCRVEKGRDGFLF